MCSILTYLQYSKHVTIMSEPDLFILLQPFPLQAWRIILNQNKKVLQAHAIVSAALTQIKITLLFYILQNYEKSVKYPTLHLFCHIVSRRLLHCLQLDVGTKTTICFQHKSLCYHNGAASSFARFYLKNKWSLPHRFWYCLSTANLLL